MTDNGKPNHPQTQGKVERFQQTMKNWLARRSLAATLTELQSQPSTPAAITSQPANPAAGHAKTT